MTYGSDARAAGAEVTRAEAGTPEPTPAGIATGSLTYGTGDTARDARSGRCLGTGFDSAAMLTRHPMPPAPYVNQSRTEEITMPPIKTMTLTLDCAITPIAGLPSRGRQGSLQNTTAKDIKAILGFRANLPASGDGKVTMQWAFRVAGYDCSIWDYKGSAKEGCWSFNGPRQIFTAIFGDRVAD